MRSGLGLGGPALLGQPDGVHRHVHGGVAVAGVVGILAARVAFRHLVDVAPILLGQAHEGADDPGREIGRHMVDELHLRRGVHLFHDVDADAADLVLHPPDHGPAEMGQHGTAVVQVPGRVHGQEHPPHGLHLIRGQRLDDHPTLAGREQARALGHLDHVGVLEDGPEAAAIHLTEVHRIAPPQFGQRLVGRPVDEGVGIGEVDRDGHQPMSTLGGGNPWASHKRHVGGQRPGAVGHALDVAVGVQVQVHPVHLEPHLGVVLDALQRVDGAGRLVQERPGPVDVVVLLVLPGARGRVAEDGTGVPVGLHLETGLEDVLDDPQPLFGLHLEHLELVAVADLDEGKIVGPDVECLGSCVKRCHVTPYLPAPVSGLASYERERREPTRAVDGPRAARARQSYLRNVPPSIGSWIPVT